MQLSYLSIIFLMVISPLPPEVFMPLAGFLVAQAKLSFWYVVLSGVTGFLISFVPWYFAARYFGEVGFRKLVDRYPRWLAAPAKNLEKGQRQFHRYRKQAILFSFFLPGTRNLIAISAGMSRTSPASFLTYSLLGATLWMLVLTGAGCLLGSRYYLIESYFTPIANIVLFALILLLIIWVLKHYSYRKKKRSFRTEEQQAVRSRV